MRRILNWLAESDIAFTAAVIATTVLIAELLVLMGAFR